MSVSDWAFSDFGGPEQVMLSALEHFSYCPRQFALIHIEQTFDDNIYTLRGSILHRRVDEPDSVSREGCRVETGLPLWSQRLGLVGRADVVEFHGDTPYPVEYKHGKKKAQFEHEALQLCGQALCLEEMTGQQVPRGAVYYYSSRQRREVVFTDGLRRRVEEVTAAIRRMLAEGTVPPPVSDSRCHNCSLNEACLPDVLADRDRLRLLSARLFRNSDPPSGRG